MASFVQIQEYDDNQVIITSDRLLFNSKLDNIFNITKKDYVISAGGSVHINVGKKGGGDASKNQFIVNAPKIQFGLGTIQPNVKGDDLAKLLTDLTNALNDLSTSLSSATGFGVGTVTNPTINSAGVKLQGQIQLISQQIDGIKSKVVYTT